MTRTLAFVVLCVASGLACASAPSSRPAPVDLSSCRSAPTEIGWIDISRVRAESALGKRLTDEDRVFVGSRNDELEKTARALAAAEKAREPHLDVMRATAAQKRAQFEAEVKQRDQEDAGRLVASIKPIAVALGTERHLARVDFETHLWAAGDLTDEVIRRMNQADGKGMAEELARAKAELAAAKAKSEPLKK